MIRRHVLIASLVFVTIVSMAARVSAQPPPGISLRPFFVVSGEGFSAKNTFQTALGSSFEPMFGGGLDATFANGLFVDVTASWLSKTGQTAFFANGQGFQLGQPLTVTLTPVEATVGYRFALMSPNVVPYVGAGGGIYIYKEETGTVGLTVQEINSGANVFDSKHAGFLGVAGVEVRVSRLIAVSGDVQYTRVPGILGSGGVSLGAGESDLGGLAVRGRVLVGR